MKITYISSATVLVEHEGIRVLCDPWLTDGILYGSWFHYPRLKHTAADFQGVDYIYISHVHQDHMDPGTLKDLPKDIPILILDFEEKFVLRILGSLGFERIIELGHGQRHWLGEDFAMEIFAADNCDPEACGVMFNCVPPATARTQQIDSMAVFEGGGQVLVNNNDCPYPLARGACDEILRRYGLPDMLLTGYSGASSYPQCYDNYDPEEMALRAAAKRGKCMRMAQGYMTQLRPRFVMPFAGQYTLGGRLSGLNKLRGMPELEELPEAFPILTRRLKPAPELVLLNDGESFDLQSGEPSAEFIPPDPIARDWYVLSKLARKTYAYDHRPNPGNLLPEVLSAQKRMMRYQEAWHQPASAWSLYLDAGEYMYRLPFDGRKATHANRLEEPFVRISLEPALLAMILNREAHLNNAEGGSHIRVLRKPDVYEQVIMRMACYLQN